MTIRLGVVMDPIASIHYKKDSTLAMLWEAKARGFELYYFELNDLFLRDGVPYGDASQLDVFHDAQKWYALGNKETMPLAELDIILMRKDPPFSEEYIYATYILEHAERLGVLVANRPQSLRDSNEKLFATHFPQCCPPALVTQSIAKLHAFWQEHKDIVCKPLNIMGGASVFRLREGDVNAQVIFEILTSNQSVYIMAQRYIPDIINGDKRIIMIDGEAVPYALARVPQGKDWRGNLAAGAKGIVQALTDRDRWICSQVGPELKSRGLYFVGIDVIGDYLTEINVTSPTCIREIDEGAKMNVSGLLLDVLVGYLRRG
jgi:glutathione synthase